MATDCVFDKELFQFFKELKRHNDRDWFQENKERYERFVKRPLAAFAEELAPRLERIAPGYGYPRLFRIHRDVRFSKDKAPYKTQASVQFQRALAGSDVHQPGFYVHLEPGGCFVGAGIWAPDAAALGRIRAAIVDHPAAWAPLAKLPLWGESYARPPKGVDPGHRFVEDLKRKHFLTCVDFEDREAIGPGFLRLAERLCKKGAPLVAFLDRALWQA
jgi:uncharacterized protein (TIGR02453 family)